MSPRVLALLSVLCLSTALAQSPTVSPERELLERTLALPGTSPDLQTTVLVRQVSPDLGLALPANSRVVGSVVTATPSPTYPAGVTVYFDTPLTPAQLGTYFDQLLTSTGWTVLPVGPEAQQEGGFLTGGPSGNGAYYRRTPDQQVNLQTVVVGRVTRVTLSRQRSSNLEQLLQFAQGGPSMPRVCCRS